MQTILTEKVDRESEYDKFETKDEKDNKKKEKKEKEKEKKAKKQKLEEATVDVADTDVFVNAKKSKEPKPVIVRDSKKKAPKKEKEVEKINPKQLMKLIDKHKYLLDVLNNTDFDKQQFIDNTKKELNICLDQLKKFSVSEKLEL
jgi:hypothetical protein